MVTSTNPGIPAIGDEVQKRYRYQFLYTILLAIRMYKKELDYEKLFCELFDDVLAVLPNKKLVAIQIKTMDKQGAAFSFNDDAVVNSLVRFIKLNSMSPDQFEKFVFVSNVDFKKERDIRKIIEQTKKNGDKKLEPKTFEEFIEKIRKKANVKRQEVIDVLNKTEIQKGPSLDDIESKVIKDHLAKIKHCRSLSVPKLEYLLNQFLLVVFKKSSRHVEDSISQYVSFVTDGKEKELSQEVESKQITSTMVEEITKKGVNSAYLISRNPSSMKLKKGSIDLMQQKMSVGGIDISEIESMTDLSYSAQTHFLEEHHKRNGEAEEIKKEINQIQTILVNQAAEAKIKTKSAETPYGEKMLREIEERLKTITEKRHQDVFFIRYEILKGVIGILASDCKIYFSEKFGA